EGENSAPQSRYRNKEEGYKAAGDIPVLAQDGEGICTQAEVCSMAQGDVACVARKDIPACSGGSEHQGKDDDAGHGWIGKYQWEGNGNHQQRKQSDRFEHAHCFLPSTCPSNSCGLTNRI